MALVSRKEEEDDEQNGDLSAMCNNVNSITRWTAADSQGAGKRKQWDRDEDQSVERHTQQQQQLVVREIQSGHWLVLTDI